VPSSKRIAELIRARKARDQVRAAGHRLISAVNADDQDGVRRLIAEGVEVDERFPRINTFNDGHTALLVASRDARTEIVRATTSLPRDVSGRKTLLIPPRWLATDGHDPEFRYKWTIGGTDHLKHVIGCNTFCWPCGNVAPDLPGCRGFTRARRDAPVEGGAPPW